MSWDIAQIPTAAELLLDPVFHEVHLAMGPSIVPEVPSAIRPFQTTCSKIDSTTERLLLALTRSLSFPLLILVEDSSPVLIEQLCCYCFPSEIHCCADEPRQGERVGWHGISICHT